MAIQPKDSAETDPGTTTSQEAVPLPKQNRYLGFILARAADGPDAAGGPGTVERAVEPGIATWSST